jgi:hypothetical protein
MSTLMMTRKRTKVAAMDIGAYRGAIVSSNGLLLQPPILSKWMARNTQRP